MIEKIMNWFGYYHCIVCGKYTQPSFLEGRICSIGCLMKAKPEKFGK